MRRTSLKKLAQLPDEAALKDYLIERHAGLCQWCEAEPGSDKHEIGRGKFRQSCVLSAAATLLVGCDCHGVLTRMPSDDAERLGLAILRDTRPEDYSLTDYLKLTTPHAMKRITAEEVDKWARRFGLRSFRPTYVKDFS